MRKAQERERKRAAGATGRRDTILTGPLGLPGEQQPAAGQKTLLGG